VGDGRPATETQVGLGGNGRKIPFGVPDTDGELSRPGPPQQVPMARPSAMAP